MALNTLSSNLFENLTDEERLKVGRFSATNSSDLPKFFNAGTQVFGEEPGEFISREFEAYLILQALRNPEKLSNAIRWFTEAANLQLKREDRDELLEEAFAEEKAESLSDLREVRALTTEFTAFRESFEVVEIEASGDSLNVPVDRFSVVPELALIMRDSQVAMGEVASKQGRLEHQVVETEVLDIDRKTRLRLQSLGSIPDERIAQELLSWRDVISQVQARVAGG